MLDLSLYTGLFTAALLAATVLPMQSEAVLAGLLLADEQPAAMLIAVASCGNILGAAINWWLGRGLERFRHHSWFPVKEAQLTRAQIWYQRYGKWSLLLSWAPVIGDPLTVAAGLMREPLPVFLLIAGSAKVARYLVLAGIILGWRA